MAEPAEPDMADAPARRLRRLLLRRVALVLGLALLGALAALWLAREELADDLIERTLKDNGIRASYRIEEIGPRRQVLRDVVVGDPARPDLTIAEVELRLRPRLGLSAITELRLTGARLYGRQQDSGRISFGALDPFLYEESVEPPELPDFALRLDDARALIVTDAGRIGMALAGAGHLRGGFAGRLAAVAPALALGGCTAGRTVLNGRVEIANLEPRFTGPLTTTGLACAEGEMALERGTAQLALVVDRNLADAEADVTLDLAGLRRGSASLAALDGTGTVSWRASALTARYDLAGRALALPGAAARVAQLSGRLRAEDGFARLEAEGDLAARGLDLGGALDGQLAGVERAAGGTLAAPLLAKLRAGLARELPGSALAASFTLRAADGDLAIVLPQARLSGASGASLLALSRAQLRSTAGGLPLFAGNFATGGEGLPQISGRMEQGGANALELRLRMARYSAGAAMAEVPELLLRQGQGGALTFAGQARLAGPLPAGFARGLSLPLDGTYGADGTLALWRGCRTLRFDALALANLSLGREQLTLCPPPGRAILSHGARGLQLAAGVESLALEGALGDTPLKLASGPLGFAWPGRLAAREVVAVIGPPDNAQTLRLARLDAALADGGVAGSLEGGAVRLAAVPLDLDEVAGQWRYADGRLDLADAGLLLSDRAAPDRFEPLLARGASLAFADGRITAEAVLRQPKSGTALARIAIAHRLDNASGEARFSVDGVRFARSGLQPADLSALAYGVVSLVEGTVAGDGRIAWNASGVVSSQGRFSSAALDLAAAFGPVKGASGTVEFTDLIGLTTAPGQRIRIAAINPGIEVNDGEVAFSLVDGQVLQLEGGRWPLMGGTLVLQPLAMNIGVAESRRWVMQIDGLDAARFVQHMELNNIAASGIFDGTIPIVFDAEGNGQLDGGVLIARAPGGHVSYVGQLAYEDLSWVGNLAFTALRDLRFREAEIQMNGPLTGELVTRVRFEGIRQGDTAEQNLITRRLARLPIRLLVNVRAPFYRLIESMRSLYDPAALRDPRSLGLITDDGTRLRPVIRGEEAANPPQPDIQPPESEAVP